MPWCHFVFGLLLSFLQLSSLAIRRLRKAFARREDQISFWIVGGSRAPFRNPINEGLATSLAIVHVAYLLSLGYNVGTFLH